MATCHYGEIQWVDVTGHIDRIEARFRGKTRVKPCARTRACSRTGARARFG